MCQVTLWGTVLVLEGLFGWLVDLVCRRRVWLPRAERGEGEGEGGGESGNEGETRRLEPVD